MALEFTKRYLLIMLEPYQKLLENLSFVEEKLGYVFQDKKKLALAFIHRSFFNENRSIVLEHNERLEFLGDSVLGLLISEYLYERLPEEQEGQLSYLMANLVDATMCALFIKKIGLVDFLLLGKGERMHDGHSKESIQADLFEALLAAMYLDGGLDAVKVFFWNWFKEDVENSLHKPLRNWKAELQDYFQKTHQKLPFYKVLSEQGPDHNKTFEVGVFLEEILLGSGVGSSKKEAEQRSAEKALGKIQEEKNG